MRLFNIFFLILALLTSLQKVSGQTRNVVMGSWEADSIECSNIGNKAFHSSIRSYTADNDSSAIYGIDKRGDNVRWTFEPLLQLGFGSQSHDYCESFNEALLGINTTLSTTQKFTLSFSMIGGYTSPLVTTAMLADSIGRFPQMDGLNNKGNGKYFAKYFEFYANYHPAKFLMLKMGKGKKFIGDGYRSMLLSASNSGMYYFDTEVTLGNFKYIFSLDGAQNWDSECNSYRQLWMIYHAFSYNPAKWITIGGYEAVMQIRRDTLGNSKFMDIHYLNPMLFFRPLEFSLGSPDNAIMGLFGKINYLKTHQAYAQFMLDDFNFNEIKEHTGTWNNKYSYQLGLKGFVGNFGYLLEFNYIRPFIYTHDRTVNSYSMYHQPLANPFGSNLKEYVMNLKYKIKDFRLNFLLDLVDIGYDQEEEFSLGNNLFKPYTLHKYNFGNYVGQGDNHKLCHVALELEYNCKALRNFKIYLRGGRQELADNLNNPTQSELNNTSENKNIYFILGIKTSKLFFDRSY